MRKYRVDYFAKQNDLGKFVDYMEVDVEGKILYSETNYGFGSNKELESYIREQAKAKGIDENKLVFFKGFN